jgi:lantibiotic leader peptide-processing serine protease
MKASAALVVLATALLVTSAGSAATRGGSGASAGTLYTVVFNNSALPANADKLVADAGGTIVRRLPKLGGLGVVSTDAAFLTRMDASPLVEATQVSGKTSIKPLFDAAPAGGAGADPQAEPDPLGNEQWDKMRMNVSSSATGSYGINQGAGVTVALTDTGVDVNHPDIAPNLDAADSRSFVPSEPTIQDYNGHGTWTASAVGAPINAIGISGVAPQVRLIELKTNDAAGNGDFQSLAAAITYAGDIGVDIVSSSIVAYAPLCLDSKSRKKGCDDADYVLMQNAVDYARAHGTLVVAALGNDDLDLSDPMAVGKAFGQPGGVIEAPGGLNGVVGVSSTGYANGKAYYSNYGLGVVDVAAPGGDPIFQPAPYTTGGGVLGAWSSDAPPAPHMTSNSGVPYAWLIGTSMAAPNAAGVAALIVGTYGHIGPAAIESRLEGTAAPQPCPQPATVKYKLGPPNKIHDSATCVGTAGQGFFGHGIVDAFAALTP